MTSSSSAPQFCSSMRLSPSELWVRAITHHVSRSTPVTQPTCPHSRVWILWIALTGMDGIHAPSRLDWRTPMTFRKKKEKKSHQKTSPAHTQLRFLGDNLTNVAAGWFQQKVGFCVICVGLTSGTVVPAQTITGNKALFFSSFHT